MKRLYFFNDWYGRLPWFLRILVVIPLGGVYLLPEYFDQNTLSYKITVVFTAILLVVGFSFQIFQAFCKNALIYHTDQQLVLRIKGKRTDIDAKFISEVSFDRNCVLQIRRINRVDSFDLSAIRKDDQQKLLRLITEFSGKNLIINDQPLLI